MLATVTFNVILPPDTTQEQAEEWINFQLGANGSISLSNPLSDTDLEADFRTLTIDFS